MSTADLPYLGQFLDLTFSADAAAGLAATNELVRQLRAIPDPALTLVLRNDRERVLHKALPDLLAAHRDARAVGTRAADVELAAALEHIRVEVLRILTQCRSRAGDNLAIQGRYLEQIYPADTDDPLALPPDASPPPTRPEQPTADAPARKVDRRSMEALFRTVSEVNASRHPAKAKHPPPPRVPSKVVAFLGDLGAAALYFFFHALPALIPLAMLFGFIWLGELHKPPKPTFRPDRVELTAAILNVRRGTVADQDYPELPRKTAAIVDLHGIVRNRDQDHVLQRQAVHLDLYSCPDDRSPLERCSWITSAEPEVTDDVIRPGVGARWSRQETMSMPDVTGLLRAVVYPDVSIFDDTRAS